MKSLSDLKSTEMRWHLTEHKGGGSSEEKTTGRQLLACGRGLPLCQSALFRSHCPKLGELGSGLIWVAGELGWKGTCLWGLLIGKGQESSADRLFQCFVVLELSV